MTRAEARTLFREYTGEFNTTTLLDARVDLYLTRGLEAYNRRCEVFVTEKTDFTITTAQEYTLPDGCVKLLHVEWDGTPLQKVDYDWVRSQGRHWRAMPAGPPKQWLVLARKLILAPAPSAAAVAADSSLTLRYVDTPGAIADAVLAVVPPQDQPLVVYHAVAEFSASHPDSGIAVRRSERFGAIFDREVAAAAAILGVNRLEKVA